MWYRGYDLKKTQKLYFTMPKIPNFLLVLVFVSSVQCYPSLFNDYEDYDNDDDSYSAFKIFWPGFEIWSFLEIFRIIFGQKIKIFKIALPARPSGSIYLGNFEIFYFLPKIILKISKNDQISEPGKNFGTNCN